MNMNAKYFLLLASMLMMLLASPAGAQASGTEPRAREGSTVTVTFKNIPTEDAVNVNGDYSVNRADGTIAMPYLESPVRVAGRTSRDIENMLRNLYISQQIYSQPIVSVSVLSTEEITEMRKRYIEVSGYVGQKKNLPYRDGITLSEAILDCGDITDYGSRYVQVTRNGKVQTYDYFSARDRSIKLHPQDKVYVRARGAFESRPRSIGR